MNEIPPTHPLISVILPVYNAEKYVAEAVESILNQTLEDFELILINDGSTDGSLGILERYSKRDSRIILVSHENRGLVASLNEGIDLARGQWLARMDADDISLPNRFERQISWLKETGADICGSWIECFGVRSVVWRYPVSYEACEAQMLFDVPCAHPAVIGRMRVFQELRYDQMFGDGEDYDLWQRAFSAGFRFTNVGHPLVRYRVHDKQVSSVRNQQQRSLAQTVRARHWRALLNDSELPAIDEIIKAFDGGDADIEGMMPALLNIRGRYNGEALGIVMFNGFRLFCRVAACNPAPWRSWRVFTSGCRKTSELHRMATLMLLRMLRIRTGTNAFEKLKRLYLR